VRRRDGAARRAALRSAELIGVLSAGHAGAAATRNPLSYQSAIGNEKEQKMNKLIAIVVVLVALSAQPCRADDPCTPPGRLPAGTPGAIYFGVDQHDGVTPVWGAHPILDSEWDTYKAEGFIAGQIAQLRDMKIGQASIGGDILQHTPSLQNPTLPWEVQLNIVNTKYVNPIYQSPMAWHDICLEYITNCYKAAASQKK
jgi:hypothetical protein